MKAKIKATGEIINIASYATITLDKCNSYGTPIEVRPEDVELITDVEEDGYWQNVRIQAAIAAMQGFITHGFSGDSLPNDRKEARQYLARTCVGVADALIEELKKK